MKPRLTFFLILMLAACSSDPYATRDKQRKNVCQVDGVDRPATLITHLSINNSVVTGDVTAQNVIQTTSWATVLVTTNNPVVEETSVSMMPVCAPWPYCAMGYGGIYGTVPVSRTIEHDVTDVFGLARVPISLFDSATAAMDKAEELAKENCETIRNEFVDSVGKRSLKYRRGLRCEAIFRQVCNYR